jgi:C-terminal processing protease CtpA/Prc
VGIAWREDEAEPGSVLLIRVVEGTPAAAAGLVVGDRIHEIDGHPFSDGTALQAEIHSMLDRGQADIPLLIERNGHVRTIVVKNGV